MRIGLGNINPVSAYQMIEQASRQLDIPLPKALPEAVKKLDAEVTAAKTATSTDADALRVAVFDAVREGRDPATDDTVRRLTTLHQLNNSHALSKTLDDYRSDARAALLLKHTPAILKSWATAITTAGDTIATARKRLPAGIDLTNAQTVTGLRPAQMKTWGEAREAMGTVDTITQAWTTLTTALGLARMQPGMRPLIVADLDAPQLAALGNNPAPADAAKAGHPLTLATPEEYQARAERVGLEKARAEEARQRAHRERMTPRGPIMYQPKAGPAY